MMGTAGPHELPGDEVPDMADVEQREDTAPVAIPAVVPVEVVGPVRVQQLPRKSASVRDQTVTTTSAVRFLHHNPTRARAVIRANQDILVGFAQDQVDSDMGLLPSGAQLELTTTGEVWVKADSVDARVVAWAEYWTN